MKINIKVKSYGGNNFYKTWNFLPDGTIENLLKSSNNLFITHLKKNEVFPPDTTLNILSDTLFEEDCWKIFLQQTQKHISQYAKLFNLDFKQIKPHSAWITRVPYNPNGHKFNAIHNLHSHTGNTVSLLYYLKNPSKKYGTIVKISESEFYLNEGEENSAFIFDASLLHSGVYPTKEELEVSPRYVISFDFIIKKEEI
jgi:hypothetical protein